MGRDARHNPVAQMAARGLQGAVAQQQNLHAAQQAEFQMKLARARADFEQHFDAGKVAVFDKLQHKLSVGDLVVMSLPAEVLFWQVAAIQINPNRPPGALEVVLTATVPLGMAVNQIQPSMLVVGHVDGDQAVVDPGGDRANDEIPPTATQESAGGRDGDSDGTTAQEPGAGPAGPSEPQAASADGAQTAE